MDYSSENLSEKDERVSDMDQNFYPEKENEEEEYPLNSDEENCTQIQSPNNL